MCCIHLVALMLLTPSVVVGQSGEDVAKGLLRALIESQLERSNRRNAPRDPFRPAPGQQEVSAEMRRLRPMVDSFAQETATLAALASTDARRSPEARKQLPSVIQLQASAAAIQQQAAVQADHRTMVDAIRQLNGAWKTVSHQLRNSSGLSRQTTAAIGRLDRLDQQYCSLLGIEERIADQALVRTAYTLSADLRTLSDEFDNQSAPPGTDRQLPFRLRKLRQEADYFASLVSRNVQLQTAVSEYRQLYSSWQQAQQDLNRYSARAAVRAAQRVQDSHRGIHQLLRLPMAADKTALLHLVHEVDQELTHLTQTLTLEHLMNLPDGDDVASAADTTFGTVQNLDDIIHRDESPQSMAEAWAYADESLKLLAYYLEGVRSPQARGQLRSISQSMQSLRDSLGITVEFDRNALVQSVSSLEALADHLVTAIQRWQTHAGDHDRSLLTQARTLVTLCHTLEQSLVRNRAPDRLQRECDQIVAAWQEVRPGLKSCETDERETLEHIAASFTPNLIRVRTLLE